MQIDRQQASSSKSLIIKDIQKCNKISHSKQRCNPSYHVEYHIFTTIRKILNYDEL